MSSGNNTQRQALKQELTFYAQKLADESGKKHSPTWRKHWARRVEMVGSRLAAPPTKNESNALARA